MAEQINFCLKIPNVLISTRAHVFTTCEFDKATFASFVEATASQLGYDIAPSNYSFVLLPDGLYAQGICFLQEGNPGNPKIGFPEMDKE